MEVFNYLSNDIDISDFYHKLPRELKELITKAEELDKQKNDAELYGVCEGIECIGKMLVPMVITYEQWERLCQKYYPY